MNLDLNTPVEVKLTETGARIWERRLIQLAMPRERFDAMRRREGEVLHINLGELMNTFGPFTLFGYLTPFEDGLIVVEKRES